LGVYLTGRQHLPVARASELMADCFNAPVSTGWLAGLLPTAARLLEPFTDMVKGLLRDAEVLHVDETGGRVAGKLRWVHVAATSTLTMYHRAEGRGKDSIDQGGVVPGFAGVLVHDGLASYRRYDTTHALCGAHHLRELAGIAETTGQAWATQLAELLVEIHHAVKTARTNGHTALPDKQLDEFVRRYEDLIVQGQALNPPPPRTGKRGRPKLGRPGSLLRRLDLYQDDVLRYATDFRVPFDNNQAERDIRMIKLQQKISGCWRTPHGADAFLTIRSYISTARKHGQNTLDALHALFTGNPWTPTPGL
jgi:transposase